MPHLSSSSSPIHLSHAVVTARLRQAGCVFAEEEARLLIDAASDDSDLESMIERRVAGLPLEQILGWAEFFGLRIAVKPGVFVPRRRTEFLAQLAISAAGELSASVVVDLCCGAGAVAAAVAASVGDAELYAADIDPAAVHCAQLNLGVNAIVVEGDLYEPLPRTLMGRIRVLVANAPYVPTAEIELMPQEARLHEARIALDGGGDGLDVQRRVAASAATWLEPGGRLMIETSERQAARTSRLMADGGLEPRIVHSDEHDATVVIGTRPRNA